MVSLHFILDIYLWIYLYSLISYSILWFIHFSVILVNLFFDNEYFFLTLNLGTNVVKTVNARRYLFLMVLVGTGKHFILVFRRLINIKFKCTYTHCKFLLLSVWLILHYVMILNVRCIRMRRTVINVKTSRSVSSSFLKI